MGKVNKDKDDLFNRLTRLPPIDLLEILLRLEFEDISFTEEDIKLIYKEYLENDSVNLFDEDFRAFVRNITSKENK